MPIWKPTTQWLGLDVFVIGGGDSLRSFNWERLKNEATIGCNAAFKLGQEICNICVFGDNKWFVTYEEELASYKGIVVTNSPALRKSRVPWLWWMERQAKGLYIDALGWNHNTGMSALNLALILGAKRVFLLGFDRHLSLEGKSNWHEFGLDKPNEDVYGRMQRDDKVVWKDWKNKFPEVEIYNVTNNSGLNIFPKVGFDSFWAKRAVG